MGRANLFALPDVRIIALVFNRLFIRYKAKAISQDESLQDFYLKQQVSYNLFHKWYMDTRYHIVQIQVKGQSDQDPAKSPSFSVPSVGTAQSSRPLKFMIDPYEQWNAHTITEFKLLKFDYLRNFAYLKEGRYSIDDTIMECLICPLAGERKNLLFFGGNRMANVSATYHTLISICWANGIAVLTYLKKFICEVVEVRRNYENLLPITIEINANKLFKQVHYLRIK